MVRHWVHKRRAGTMIVEAKLMSDINVIRCCEHNHGVNFAQGPGYSCQWSAVIRGSVASWRFNVFVVELAAPASMRWRRAGASRLYP